MSELSYTIYEPREVKKDLVARADELVFVKDGFSGWAMLAAPFWMIYHRLWIPLIGFVIALTVLQTIAHLFGAPEESNGLLFVGLSLGFGFLANDIRRILLERRGYRLVGAVAGHSQIECERRFFANWLPLAENQADDIFESMAENSANNIEGHRAL